MQKKMASHNSFPCITQFTIPDASQLHHVTFISVLKSYVEYPLALYRLWHHHDTMERDSQDADVQRMTA